MSATGAIVCPDSCTDQIAEMLFNLCAPDWNEGGIPNIYFTNIGYPITATEGDSAAIRAEFLARISNSSVAANAIRQLTTLGDKPAPTKTEIQLSANRKIVTSKEHVINFVIDETNLTNYGFLRTLECGLKYLCWFVNGKYMNGGDAQFVDGIEVSVTLDDIIPQSDKELNTYVGTITWSSKISPTKMLNPLA